MTFKNISIAFIVLLVFSCATGGGSSSSTNEPTVIQDETASVNLLVNIKEETSSAMKNASGTLSDVVGVSIEIKNGTSLLTEASLELDATSGEYSGSVDGLPFDIELTFIANAFNSSGEAIFTSTNTSTLLKGVVNSIVFNLESIDDNNTDVGTPSVLLAILPSSMEPSIATNLKFTFSKTVDFTLSSNLGSLNKTSGNVLFGDTLVVVYTSFANESIDTLTLKISSDGSDTLTLTYNINIIQTVSGIVTLGSEFGPVISSLNIERTSTTLTVTPNVSNGTLSYNWSGQESFSFINDTNKTLIINNFENTMSGNLILLVTDSDEMTATITRFIDINDYPYIVEEPEVPYITDVYTGLVWLEVEDPLNKNYSKALTYCQNLGVNYDDWRLPTKLELDEVFNNNILEMVFDEQYWSSTNEGEAIFSTSIETKNLLTGEDLITSKKSKANTKCVWNN